MSLEPGVHLGPYEVVSAVGAGGMGEVFRGRDTRLGRDVAIKVLSGRRPDDRHSDRLEQEARTLSRLTHPNVCTLYDVGEHEGTPYLVMEFLQGQTLSAALQAGPLPIPQALDYALQITDGLVKAHALGVIHRDLKPANVMITTEGLVKILDFGLAKRYGATDLEMTATVPGTERGIIVGTVEYMAPEQTTSGQVDVRTDVFAFGAMFYEMLTGARAFRGGDLISTIRRINDEEPRSVALVRPDVPPEIVAIVKRALAKNPADRFQSMADLRAHLKQAAGQNLSGRDRVAPRSGTWAQVTRRPLLAGVVLVALAAIAYGSWWFIGARRGIDSDSSASGGALPSDAVGWARRGQTLIARYDRPENVDHAIDAFQKAITMDSASALAHAGLAEGYVRKDGSTPDAQWKRLAAESARNALARGPDLAISHLVNGMVLLRQGQRDEATAAILKARDLDPKNTEAIRWLGDCYLAAGDNVKAEEAYRLAVDLAPNDWRTQISLGRFSYLRARYGEAVQSWERARDLSPDNVLVLRNLAGAYHMLERVDDAVATLQRALEIQPNATSYSNLGTLRYFQGRYQDAALAFEKAVDLNPTYYLYWGNLGDSYRWIAGSDAKARQTFSRAAALATERLQSNPADADLRSSLAGYLAKQELKESTLEQIRLIEQSPQRTPASYFKTAIAYELIGQRSLALRDLESSLRAGYTRREVVNEPELLRLRSDPGYHRMLSRLDVK